jgi:hypothetical protein
VRDTLSLIAIPLKVAWVVDLVVSILRHSAMKRKRMGERGNPSLIPLSSMKKGEVSPLKRIVNDEEFRKLRIQEKKM